MVNVTAAPAADTRILPYRPEASTSTVDAATPLISAATSVPSGAGFPSMVAEPRNPGGGAPWAGTAALTAPDDTVSAKPKAAIAKIMKNAAVGPISRVPTRFAIIVPSCLIAPRRKFMRWAPNPCRSGERVIGANVRTATRQGEGKRYFLLSRISRLRYLALLPQRASVNAIRRRQADWFTAFHGLRAGKLGAGPTIRPLASYLPYQTAPAYR